MSRAFSIDDVPESTGGYTLLPQGGYRVVVSKCEFKHKQGDVHTNYFSTCFDVLPYDGVSDYNLMGRKLFKNFTWENSNATAVEIGRGQLADLIFAVNGKGFEFPNQLAEIILDKELFVSVTHKKRKDTGEMETDIAGFWSVSGKQRKKDSKPLPTPPTAQAVANAPAQAPKKAGYKAPDIDEDVPF